jgi:Uma2 family endonuclease
LLVEILSPSTERYDRTLKANQYRTIASLRELLLISQDRYEVRLYRRSPDGAWAVSDVTGLDGSVELTSIGYVLRLRDLYAKVLAAGTVR